MSTIISLVVVGICVAATTWIVVRSGGQPATATDADHRAGEHGPRAAPEVAPTREQVEELEPVSAAEVLVLDPEPEPVVVPEPDDATPARTRAPERVRARRRDHGGLHRTPRSDAPHLLVPPDEVPPAESARTGVASRVRSGLVLIGIVVVAGTSAAVLLGATILLVTRVLGDAVQ